MSARFALRWLVVSILGGWLLGAESPRVESEGAPPGPSGLSRPPRDARGPWDNDVVAWRVEPDGRAEPVATFERAGVPSVARLADGRLIAAHQSFPEKPPEDFDKVAVRFSTDEGATWTEARTIRVEGLPEGLRFPFDPTLVPLPDGRIRLYFTSVRGRTFEDGAPAIYSAVSKDGLLYDFEPGVRFAVEGRIVIDCAVVLHRGTFHLFAPDNGAARSRREPPPGGEGPGRPQEGAGYHAVSEDGLAFRRVEDVHIGGRRKWLGAAVSDGIRISFYGTGEPEPHGIEDSPPRPAREEPQAGEPPRSVPPLRPRGGIWVGTSEDGRDWTLARAPEVGGADPGAVRLRDGALLVVATGGPRPGTPSARGVHPIVKALGATRHGPFVPRKKLIATGWDSPTPAQFRRHLAEFESWPFDGTTIQPRRQLPDGKSVDAKFAFSRERWDPREFTEAIADLSAARPRTATDNFLMLYANPGDVDWFDDEGWSEIAEHWRQLSRVAREGGMKGILFDAEPYTPPHEQFRYAAQPGRDRHTFTEYAVKARERGREVMRAAAGEFPEVRILTYRLLCDLLPATDSGGDPAARLQFHTYGLVPAFLDGWFDVMPPTVDIIEGDENAYRYNSDAEFDRAFVDLRTRAMSLVAPEHHMRFRGQYRISHGIYLDAHVNPPTSPWFIDRLGGTPAARLEANVAAALRAADEYVWIYGETARWWPSGNPQHPLWPEKLPGADRALLRAKDPVGAARGRLATAKPEENRLQDAGFAERTAGGQPKGWWFWQDDASRGASAHDTDTGALAKGSARAAGTDNGCFGQGVQVRAGETYAISVRVRQEGRGVAGATVRWKTPAGAWTAEIRDVQLAAVGAADAAGWREHAGLVKVPDSAGELVLLLTARGQAGAADVAWFDDARVVQMD